MGLSLFSNGNTNPPNPNPKSFIIKDLKEFGGGNHSVTVVEVFYPGCTTHLGMKILVFYGTPTQIQRRVDLDPHFLDNDSSPIARFPATLEGRADAHAYATWKAQR